MRNCYNYRSASLELYGDERLVNEPETVAENKTVAMETAIWFWKHRVHNVSDVLGGHFGATTKAIVSQECGHNLEERNVAKKRYQRFTDCLKAYNCTDNDHFEKGCSRPYGSDSAEHDRDSKFNLSYCFYNTGWTHNSELLLWINFEKESK